MNEDKEAPDYNEEEIGLYPSERKDELYIYSLKKMAEKNLSLQKHIDFTGLCSVSEFYYRCNEMLADNPNRKYAMIRLDLYSFKTINEFCGRKHADELLKHIGMVFHQYESDSCIASHFRADIFAAFMTYEDEIQIVDIVRKMNNAISRYKIECKVLPAFGICFDKESEASIMCDYANLALQQVKGKIYSYYSVYNDKLKKKLYNEKVIENAISPALSNRYLNTYIQPKVDILTGMINGGEALVRWNDPEIGMMFPNQFIPILEKNGYIIHVDHYVWEDIFAMLARWKNEGRRLIPISINVSRLHAYEGDFSKIICDLANKYNIDSKYIKLEITESAFTENDNGLFSDMKHLQELGFAISMDDFGSGYSSINMLKNQTIDEAKIDKAFIDGIESEKGIIIIKHVISMLKELGIEMIAEGVETYRQAEKLAELGCMNAQGFYYYKPMPISEFEGLLL